jgi:hypothetical protein
MGWGRGLAIVSVCASVLACTTPDIEGTPLQQRVVGEAPSSPGDPPPAEQSSKDEGKPPKTDKGDGGTSPCKVDDDDHDCGTDRKKLDCESESAMTEAMKANPACVKEEPDDSDDHDLCCPK